MFVNKELVQQIMVSHIMKYGAAIEKTEVDPPMCADIE